MGVSNPGDARAEIGRASLDSPNHAFDSTGDQSRWYDDGSPYAVTIQFGSSCQSTCSAGPAGPKGDKGDPGDQGPKGDTGAAGAKGDTGDQGPKGDTGAAGAKGDTGAAGPKGDTGPQGPRGLPGANGKDLVNQPGSVGIFLRSVGCPAGTIYYGEGRLPGQASRGRERDWDHDHDDQVLRVVYCGY
ncbi:MAG: collagen-like protein [Deltaproteobacteria bacterium]|nr:collagen-like protein [Deltaproteobacteria bacterium]